MTYKLTVADMQCEHCVARIQTALAAKGLDFEVSLLEKTVIINGCEHCLNTALETLDNLGFSGELKD